MKCSLKDGFIINILLIVFIVPSKGIEFPLFLHRSSVQEKPMNLEEFRASINKLQDLDSFPGTGATQWHRIVKKQMASCDYRDARKSKRSVGDVTPEVEVENVGPLHPRSAETVERSSLFRKLKDFAKEKELFKKRTKKNDPNKAKKEQQKKQEENMKKMEKEKQEREEECRKAMKEKELKELKDKLNQNRCLVKVCRRIPDTNDYRCYYECVAAPNGCMKLKHRRCPKGQFFSFKYLKCLKPIPAPPEEGGVKPRGKGGGCRSSRKTSIFKSKKEELPDFNPEDPEPANEWLDANQSSNQNPDLPNEFKPQKKPCLRIYHLRTKRKLEETRRNEASLNLRGGYAPPHAGSHPSKVHGIVKKHGVRHHLPRSFVIRINKKEDQITDSDENETDSDEDDEESDEEEEEEEDEDEDAEEEEIKEEKSGAKESIKELFRSAKEAVTSRARFEDPTEQAISRPTSVTRPASAPKDVKSDESAIKNAGKKVLIDANIKVDSTISGLLRSFLKAKRKDKEANAGFLEDLETSLGEKERVSPEVTNVYEHLMLNNPRLKRYFLVNCGEGGN